MKIAFVHCPFGHRIFSENLKVVDEDFCVAPPIILAYVAAIAEKAGHEVTLIDAHALGLSKEKTLRILRNFCPDIVAFRADTYWFHAVREWAEYIKKNLDTTIIVGGLNITLYPAESLSYPCFDYGIAGEALESFPRLLSAIERNASPAAIPGVVYRKDGMLFCNSPVDAVVAFDDYPFPARHLLPNHRYYSFTSQRKNYTVMLTSTGCPFSCSFCAIVKMPYRLRSADNVVKEIEECYYKHNVREIDFFDATFFVDKNRDKKICEEILRRKIKIEWSCRSRVDAVDDEILAVASRSGCRKIYYGIESASDVVLKGVNKDTCVAQAKMAVELTRKHGIHTLGFFMVGNPGDDRQSIESSIRLAKSLRLDFIHVCRTIAKPNTGLHHDLIKKDGRDYWKEYILGERGEERLPHPWSGLSEKEIEDYLRRFYNEFYFRPAYIVRRMADIKSVFELLKYLRSGVRWFFRNYSDLRSYPEHGLRNKKIIKNAF